MSSNTVIAFDFGTKSIGVAVGQTITGTARPLAALNAREGIPDWELIAAVFREWQPDYVVAGLPLNMGGTPQLATNQAKKFTNRLHGRFGIRAELHDERLSTVEARANLFADGGYRALGKDKVDSASAVIILESWFEQLYG